MTRGKTGPHGKIPPPASKMLILTHGKSGLLLTETDSAEWTAPRINDEVSSNPISDSLDENYPSFRTRKESLQVADSLSFPMDPPPITDGKSRIPR